MKKVFQSLLSWIRHFRVVEGWAKDYSTEFQSLLSWIRHFRQSVLMQAY